jgi:hypothetical protein
VKPPWLLVAVAAVFALLRRSVATAGLPEQPSGRMALDEASEGLWKYRLEKDQGNRIGWLRNLAPTRDPWVAVEF